MSTPAGMISKPIREMMDGNQYGRVIFKVRDFKQKFNTRTAALGHKRHGYDLYTQGATDDEVQVICRGREALPALIVDLKPYA